MADREEEEPRPPLGLATRAIIARRGAVPASLLASVEDGRRAGLWPARDDEQTSPIGFAGLDEAARPAARPGGPSLAKHDGRPNDEMA